MRTSDLMLYKSRTCPTLRGSEEAAGGSGELACSAGTISGI